MLAPGCNGTPAHGGPRRPRCSVGEGRTTPQGACCYSGARPRLMTVGNTRGRRRYSFRTPALNSKAPAEAKLSVGGREVKEKRRPGHVHLPSCLRSVRSNPIDAHQGVLFWAMHKCRCRWTQAGPKDPPPTQNFLYEPGADHDARSLFGDGSGYSAGPYGKRALCRQIERDFVLVSNLTNGPS